MALKPLQLKFNCYLWHFALSYKLIKDKYIFVLMHFMLEGIQKDIAKGIELGLFLIYFGPSMGCTREGKDILFKMKPSGFGDTL